MEKERVPLNTPETERLELIICLRTNWRYVQHNYRRIVKGFGLIDFVPMRLHYVAERLQEVIEAIAQGKATMSEIGVAPEELAKIKKRVRRHQRLAWLYRCLFVFMIKHNLDFHNRH